MSNREPRGYSGGRSQVRSCTSASRTLLWLLMPSSIQPPGQGRLQAALWLSAQCQGLGTGTSKLL